MAETGNEIVEKIKPLIDSDIELTILYGSAASNRLTDRSDIDIAIGSNKRISNDKSLELSLKLTHLLNREVSVIDISKMEGVILKEVLQKGLTVKNSDPILKALYITKMITFTEDILPYHILSYKNRIKDFLNDE
ncbi:MAG: nucleotidyltransferase domain-containing protein [Spirochaetaceae bacterium]